MSEHPTAAEIREALQLKPNQTCGFVRNTYRSALAIAPGGLPAPFEAGRPLGTALFFMMTPDAPVKLHRIINAQVYHYYLGDPIELRLMYVSGETERIVADPDALGGQRVQVFIPGGTFDTARIAGQRRCFVGGSAEWPGVDPIRDFELGNAEELAAKYPGAAADIRDFAQPQ
jgi:predicted cupin superfamily sugar epimerase